MNIKKIQYPVICLFLITVFLVIFASCSSIESTVHEPLTIITAKKDYTEFEKAFKKAYPDINLQFISYDGNNSTEYLHRILESGNAPDIYTSDILPDEEVQEKYLLDLSGYEFSSKYTVSRLNECSVKGAIYMLPCNYSVFGIYYNKTLFEKYGWEVPKSFNELEALAPEIKKANVNLAVTELEFTGSAFQYLFNLGDTTFLRTPSGVLWVDEFQIGKVSADKVWDDTLKYIQKWIDLGLINGNSYGLTLNECNEKFTEGNTAFYICGRSIKFSQLENSLGYKYGIIPWLSEEGTNNRYITCTNCYYGLNADLEKPENKQKLNDALKFMEFISTKEGQRLLPGGEIDLLPLQNDGTDENDEYREVIKMLNDGYSAPLAYAGWEDVIVPVGSECIKWYIGESSSDKVIEVLNKSMQDSQNGTAKSYCTVVDDLKLTETAHLVANAFIEATGADCALISLGEYHNGLENPYGVNGCLWSGDVTDPIICTINPLGWINTISTAELTGQKIQELLQTGFDLYGDGNPFPYILTLPDDKTLVDDETYTVVICGYISKQRNSPPLHDTGICGMDALRSYFSKKKCITRENCCDVYN